MTKLKREIFNRPTRMVHEFGQTLERNDPLGRGTFDFTPPMLMRASRGADGVNVQNRGDHSYYEPRSPVQKPNGQLASINGPALDTATCIAQPIPASTKGRSFPKAGL